MAKRVRTDQNIPRQLLTLADRPIFKAQNPVFSWRKQILSGVEISLSEMEHLTKGGYNSLAGF